MSCFPMWITTGYKAASEGRTASLRAVVREPCPVGSWPQSLDTTLLGSSGSQSSTKFFLLWWVNCPHALKVAMLTIDRIVKDSVIGY